MSSTVEQRGGKVHGVMRPREAKAVQQETRMDRVALFKALLERESELECGKRREERGESAEGREST